MRSGLCVALRLRFCFRWLIASPYFFSRCHSKRRVASPYRQLTGALLQAAFFTPVVDSTAHAEGQTERRRHWECTRGAASVLLRST